MLINFVDEAVILVPSEHALPLAAIKISKLCCLLYFLTFDIPSQARLAVREVRFI